jgi:uncharacterized protein YyaL (SSP411 family)
MMSRMDDSETIKWQSWDKAAFRLAEKTGRPIFLSITASWCHWCHVMDEESFTHPEAIRRINREFIPVRVDSDKRPDINSRYNMGGWPTVAILNAEGEVIVGDTYLPLGQLLAMLSAFKSIPEKAEQRTAKRDLKAPSPVPPLDDSLVWTAAGFLERAFDRQFGGFGSAPKFPQPWAVELALHLHQRTGEKKWLEMANLTLDAMREGALYDHVEGGFFRYATMDNWENPHYEKLLEVNARMASTYLAAYHLTGQSAYRATAQGVLDYLFSSLAVPGEPWFCGSQAADRDYYDRPEEERTWTESPGLDRTMYTDQNAVTASSLFLAYSVLEDSKYRDAGLKLIDHLWAHRYQPEKGMDHCDDGEISLLGYLSDQVQMVQALLDAFVATGTRSYLNRAEQLAQVMNKQLWDPSYSGYWDLPADSEDRHAIAVRIKPFSENAVAAMALTRLYRLTGVEDYQKRAEAVLLYLSTVYAAYKHYAAPFAVAVEQFLASTRQSEPRS